jgi:phospholipase C
VKRRILVRPLIVCAAAMLTATALASAATASEQDGREGRSPAPRPRHIVVIYQENHSFDNLYGRWPGVNGLPSADSAHTRQVNQAGAPFQCLLQNDVNLTSPPLGATCTDTTTPTSFQSHFGNQPFFIDQHIGPEATTCPAPGTFAANGVPKGSGQPGGCTRDLVHRYYQEQYQLNRGRQDRYTTGSDAVGLTQGVYDTRSLPVYRYLHSEAHPRYAVADAFFASSFGGSFLNHQWLVAARTPESSGASNDGTAAKDLHSVVDANGMPSNYPLYKSPAGTTVKDNALTASCTPGPGRGPTPPGTVCGDYAVNTIQPAYQPYTPGTPAAKRLPPLATATIGDRLSPAGVDWAWYAGGWSNADGRVGAPGWTNGTTPGTCNDAHTRSDATYPNCPDKLFQFHHQPFNYYAAYAPGTPARTQHLRDEVEFLSAAGASKETCDLKPVSFVKPVGGENEHPGYTGETSGSDHLVKLLQAIEGGPCAGDTMVVVTYDEFGGSWDRRRDRTTSGGPAPAYPR